MKKLFIICLSTIFVYQLSYGQASTGSYPQFKFIKTQGSLGANASIGNLRFYGVSNESYLEGAAIRVTVSDNPMSDFLSMDMKFETGITKLEERLRIEANGSIGINTSIPSARLEIQQFFSNENATNTLFQVTGGLNDKPGLFTIEHNGDKSELLKAKLDGDFEIQQGGLLVKDKDIVASSGRLFVNTQAQALNGEHIAYFNGSIIATEAWIKTYPSWPDYVFEKNYSLMSLKAIEAYIYENGHLPNIPSAAEVATGGFGLAELQAKSLEKIEELTLHLINMEKSNEQELRAANDRIDNLEKRLLAMEKLLLSTHYEQGE